MYRVKFGKLVDTAKESRRAKTVFVKIRDLFDYEILRSKKNKKKLLELSNFFKDKTPPKLPINAHYLMREFNIPEGKEIGSKLKKIEDQWINNNFKISNQEIQKLVLS